MSDTATLAPSGVNDPHHAEALALATRVGGNFKTLRDNKRKLAHSLVLASVVDNHALASVITEAKANLKWGKLDKPEQNQMNVLFTSVRAIDGAWKALDETTRAEFIAGSIAPSTLAKSIKDAETEALAAKAKADAEADVKSGEAPSMTPEGGADIGADAPTFSITTLAAQLAGLLESATALTEGEGTALAAIMAQVARLSAPPVALAQAA